MKIISFLLACIFAMSTAATEVYISRDAKGNMVFSDRPSSNAEVLSIKELPSMPAYTVPEKVEPTSTTKEQDFSYSSLAIISPANNFTLETGYTGNLDVTALLSPSLRDTDTLYLLDNNQVIRKGRQGAFSLTNLDRGEHVFQVVVRDEKGNTLITSNSVAVHVKRASVLNRKN